MKSWNLTKLDLRPHKPQILSSTDDGRAIVLVIPAGESMQDHLHQRAWMTVIEGEVEITTTGGGQIDGAAGLLLEFDPLERHAVHARTDARLLLLLTPWPGVGRPGAMTAEEGQVGESAAEHQRPA